MFCRVFSRALAQWLGGLPHSAAFTWRKLTLPKRVTRTVWPGNLHLRGTPSDMWTRSRKWESLHGQIGYIYSTKAGIVSIIKRPWPHFSWYKMRCIIVVSLFLTSRTYFRIYKNCRTHQVESTLLPPPPFPWKNALLLDEKGRFKCFRIGIFGWIRLQSQMFPRLFSFFFHFL